MSRSRPGAGLMVCGTTSDAGKSLVVTGLCRLAARRGVRVAPFKAQNMALNSDVTVEGGEIGRAQAAQASAAGVAPEVAMNPILLKPTGERTSQVVVRGRPWAVLTAAEYHQAKPALLEVVLESLRDLRSRFDLVICEGAGSPAEINLLDHDIVNLRVAAEAGLQALLVGDIDRGGVFAAFAGTLVLLPDDLRPLVGGFVVNKFRGDPALLEGAAAELESRTGVPTLGILPWLDGAGGLDAEDSLALRGARPTPARAPLADSIDVAAIALPHLSNFTDLDPLAIEPGVGVRWVRGPAELGRPDLVVLPGTKSTVADLAWLRASGLADAIGALSEALVLGICGGYQMLGTRIEDPEGVESDVAVTDGLGHLDVTTRFEPDKRTDRVSGTVMGERVEGFRIHHGRVSPGRGAAPWIALDESVTSDGAVDLVDARHIGTTLHGLFEADGFRKAFCTEVARRAERCFVADPEVSFAAARRAGHDAVADAIEATCDLEAIAALALTGRRSP